MQGIENGINSTDVERNQPKQFITFGHNFSVVANTTLLFGLALEFFFFQNCDISGTSKVKRSVSRNC